MSLDALHPAVTAVPIGIAFGVILERVGLGDPRVIAGQLTGRDFTVVRVMFGAIVTAMLGLVWAGAAGWIDPASVAMPPTDLPAQALGAVVFGGGFALAALCPGTACVAAASGRRDGLAAVGGLFAGTALTPVAWPALRGAVSDVPREGATIAADLGVPLGLVVVLVTAAAVLAMIVGRLMDARRFAGNPWRPTTPESVALALAATFALADGRGALPSARTHAIATEIVREADHIDALDLAGLIMAGAPGLRVLDLREDLDTSTYLSPGARPVSITALDSLTVTVGDRLVLYSDGGAHAAQAWVLLRVRGIRNALVLKDGMAAWEDEVLAPMLPAVEHDSARARFARAKDLSLWFGGFPRLVPDETSSSLPRARRRRTC
jgi:rhodanese-related sulfurtransferase